MILDVLGLILDLVAHFLVGRIVEESVLCGSAGTEGTVVPVSGRTELEATSEVEGASELEGGTEMDVSI